MMDRDVHRLFDLTYTKPTVNDGHHMRGVKPDMHVQSVANIKPGQLTGLGVDHVVLGLQGTLVPVGTKSIYVPEAIKTALHAISRMPKLESLNVLTEGQDRVLDIRRGLGLAAVNVFSSRYSMNHDDQLLETPRPITGPILWGSILFELDIVDEPHRAVMIGYSPAREIAPAQARCIRTVQVDRLERRPKSAA